MFTCVHICGLQRSITSGEVAHCSLCMVQEWLSENWRAAWVEAGRRFDHGKAETNLPLERVST